MQILIWNNFSKRTNSTKQPNTEDAITKNVTLKENTSLDTPIFIFSGNIENMTYIQLGFTFYFVSEIVSIAKDLYEVSCVKDVLATYRNVIGDSTQFISRAASQYNVELPDNVYTPQLESQHSTLTTNVPMINSQGTYVARVITSTGIVNYAGSEGNINTVIGNCYNNDLFDGFEELFEEISKNLFDYTQYLIESYWIPVTNVTSQDLLIFIGKYWTEGSSPRLTSKSLVNEFAISTPSRYYGDYRDYDTRFTEFILDLPGIGTCTLSPQDVYAGLSCKVTFDCITGFVKYEIYSGGSIITEFRSCYKVPIQVSGMTTEGLVGGLMQTISGAAETVVGASTLNGGAVAEGLKNIGAGAITTQKDTPHLLGSQGSIIDVANDPNIHLTRITHSCSQAPIFNLGRKLNEYRTIKTLNGFIQCINASIDVASESGDRDSINNYLNSGFYYE